MENFRLPKSVADLHEQVGKLNTPLTEGDRDEYLERVLTHYEDTNNTKNAIYQEARSLFKRFGG